MDEQLQLECFRLIKKYKSLSREYYKVRYRNELYNILGRYIVIWIKTTLNRWKRYLSEEEILSYSWDAFCFCLDSYNSDKFTTHVPYFFSKYTNYWLLIHFAKSDERILIPIEELEETLSLVDEPENIAFGKLLKLYRYRDTLSDEVKVVWDDAYLSLTHTEGDKKRSYKSENIDLPQRVYYTLKQSFKGIIRQILEE